MTNNPQGTSISLKLALEKAALAESRKGVTDLTKEFLEAKAAVKDAGNEWDGALTELADNLDKAVKSNAELEASFKKTTAAAKELGDTAKSSGGGFGVEGLRRTGGALTQLGLGDIGQPIQRIGDLGQVIKEAGAISEAANVSITGTKVAVGGLEVALAPLLVTVGLVGAAVVSLVFIFKQMESQSKAVTDQLQKEHQAKLDQIEQDAQNREIARSKTEAQNKQDIKDASDYITDLGGHLSDLRDLKAKNDQDYADLGSSFNPSKRHELADKGVELQKEIDDTRALLDKADQGFQNLTLALPPLIAEETAHKDAIEATADAQSDVAKAAHDATQNQVRDAELVRNAHKGSSDALKAQIASMDDTVAAEQAELVKLRAIKDPTKETTDRIAALSDHIKMMSTDSLHLTTVILPLVEAREKETIAADASKKAIEDKTKADQKQNEQLSNAYKKNVEDQAKIVADGAEARKAIDSKLTDDLAKIEQDGIVRRAAIAQQYSDKLIDIANSAADAAADTLRGLDQKYADNALALQRNSADLVTKGKQDQLKIEIDAQRTETQNAIDHARALEDIRNRSRAGDLKLLRDRNFLGLLNSRESEAGDLNAENTRYGRQQQDAQRATQEKQQDAQAALNQERQQRLLAYQRANQDAKTAADRQLAQQQINEKRQIDAAKVARDRAYRDQSADEQRAITAARQANAQQLRELSDKIIKERDLRYAGYKNELKLLQQTEAQRASIIAAYAAQARNALGQPARGGQGGSSAGVGFHAAGGGKIIVNDGGQQEGFNGVPFPPVLGSFTPFRSGAINPSVGGQTTNIFNIRAHDTDGVRREVVSVLKQVQGVK